MIQKWGLVWHHVEDLETMILIDGRIHRGIDHWGSNSILERINSETFKTIWKKLVRLVGYAD